MTASAPAQTLVLIIAPKLCTSSTPSSITTEEFLSFLEDNYYDIDYTNMSFALIMGAEHTGISKSLLKLSDFRVKIPMMTDFNSLNVSNAAAIILFESVKQKKKASNK